MIVIVHLVRTSLAQASDRPPPSNTERLFHCSRPLLQATASAVSSTHSHHLDPHPRSEHDLITFIEPRFQIVRQGTLKSTRLDLPECTLFSSEMHFKSPEQGGCTVLDDFLEVLERPSVAGDAVVVAPEPPAFGCPVSPAAETAVPAHLFEIL